MKEQWVPLSNRMYPSTVVCAAKMLAMADFNKHTLVEIADDVVAAAVGAFHSE